MDPKTLQELRKALRGKRARFVEEYIKDGNGTAAAIRAGVPEKGAAVQASRFLLEPAVRAYKDALIEAEAEAIGVDRNSLIAKSEQVFRRCMQHDAVLDKEGNETGVYVFDARGAVRALEIQAKITGNLTERRELDGGGFEVVITKRDERKDERKEG